MPKKRTRVGRSPRRRWVGIVVITLVVSAFLAAASRVPAAPTAGSACPALTGHKWHASYGSRSGRRYQWSVVGKAWKCKTAKRWVAKLVKDRPRRKTGFIPLKNGPKGLHCYATLLDKKGYAFTGVCFKGTFAYPITGFQWAGG